MSKIKLMIEVEDEDELDWVVNRGCIMADRLRNAKRIEESEDAVSRKAVLEVFGDVHPLDYNANVYVSQIRKLPPVNPKLDVLDKIKADVEEQVVPRSVYTDKQKKQVLAIIDNYRKGNKE